MHHTTKSEEPEYKLDEGHQIMTEYIFIIHSKEDEMCGELSRYGSDRKRWFTCLGIKSKAINATGLGGL
jgi:hypothetical protein